MIGQNIKLFPTRKPISTTQHHPPPGVQPSVERAALMPSVLPHPSSPSPPPPCPPRYQDGAQPKRDEGQRASTINLRVVDHALGVQIMV